MWLIPDSAGFREGNDAHEPKGTPDKNGDGRGDGGQFARRPHAWDVAKGIVKDFPQADLRLQNSAVEGKTAWTVDRIVLPPKDRGKGMGSAIMRRVITEADKYHVALVLLPSADYGGEVPRLRQFYSRFGFSPNNGRVTAPYGKAAQGEIMIRNPKE